MTTAGRARTTKPVAPSADPLDGIPCCQTCGAILYEDLLGRLRCLIPDCTKHREVVGQADIDPGVLTAELLKPPDAEP